MVLIGASAIVTFKVTADAFDVLSEMQITTDVNTQWRPSVYGLSALHGHRIPHLHRHV